MRRHVVTDLNECRTLWDRLIEPRKVSDLWEFRLCFQRHFKNKPWFLVLEDNQGIAGMLPLSYLHDLDMFVFFPGEIWKGRTWIERTPLYVRDNEFLIELLSSCPDRTYLRYMEVPEGAQCQELEIDETGYVLHLPGLEFELANYLNRFSRKRIKAILKDIRTLTNEDGQFYLNRFEDFDALVRMSILNFGEDAYLFERRLRECFRDAMYFLQRGGYLQLVSLQVKEKTVAVDLGAIYRGTYTIFMGGTHPEVPGIAKAINMRHIEISCGKKLSCVDFLCGDFHWKTLWHLDPEPLYKFVTPALSAGEEMGWAMDTDMTDLVSPGYAAHEDEGEGIRCDSARQL
jgi:hypothetical protein